MSAQPPALVLVPTLLPLGFYHQRVDEHRTACGCFTHGWYAMTPEAARENLTQPCSVCWPSGAED